MYVLFSLRYFFTFYLLIEIGMSSMLSINVYFIKDVLLSNNSAPMSEVIM